MANKTNSGKSEMLKQMLILSGLEVNSKNLYSVLQKTLLVSFMQPKPLFPDNEKALAASLMEKSVPLFITGFGLLNGSLTVDKRELGQCFRSGLQYLVDEFQEYNEIYQKLQPMFTSVTVKNVEEFIEDTKHSVQDYPDFAFTVGLEKQKETPSTHYWWF